MFPVLRIKGIDVDAIYTRDHNPKLGTIYVAPSWKSATPPILPPALTRIAVLLEELERNLTEHLDMGEEKLIPPVLDKFTFDEQAELAKRVIADTPAELVSKLEPRPFLSLSPEHRGVMLLRKEPRSRPSSTTL